jgi:ribosomal protein S18 acetylase RimI-like enzyme
VSDIERMAAVLPKAWSARARSCGGVVHDVDGLLVCLTGVPAEPFNPTLVVHTPDDVDAALAAAADHCADVGLALGIDLEPSLHGAIRDAARRAGFSLVETRPGMALHLGELRSPPDPPGIVIRRVRDASTLAKVGEADAAAFDVKPELMEAFLPAAVLDDPAERVFAALDGDDVVGAGESVMFDGVLGVFGISTVPPFRRKGIAAALTSRLIEDRSDEVDLVMLQSSQLGSGVYERLGFRTISTWEVWATSTAAASAGGILDR